MNLDDYIESSKTEPSSPTGRKCRTCVEYSELLDDIEGFLIRKAAGEIFIPVRSETRKSLYQYLLARGYKLSGLTLQRHIRGCLRRDHLTGASLDE